MQSHDRGIQGYEFQKGRYAIELTLRVPGSRFDSFITRLQDLGEPANLNKSCKDITLPVFLIIGLIVFLLISLVKAYRR